uniref:Uncharacterized protein n=1 Tax=Oryza glaberrima TaxID=4538 RepID=I1PGL0_ORYGL
MPNNFGFDPIPFHLLQQRERRHVMVALERTLCTTAATSSPFPLIWTKPGQAIEPAFSPRPPLHFPQESRRMVLRVRRSATVFFTSGRRRHCRFRLLR